MPTSETDGQRDGEWEELAGYLHDLGLMLSYRADESLRDIGVLNPQWVTKGIYDMLNSPRLRKKNGKLTLDDFAAILPPRAYPPALHPYLLGLMRKFQLCHPLDDDGKRYLIPELLTKEEPKVGDEFSPGKCLGFAYMYDAVLPEGLLPRFIVETYVLREPKHVWRTGVVLERGHCRALVRADVQGRRITIGVNGPAKERRELLGIIREHFDRLHATYEKLPVTEVVPIPNVPGAEVRHELLRKYEVAGKESILVEVGNGLKPFYVKTLLEGVDLPGAFRGTEIDKILVEAVAPTLFISYSHKDERFRDELRGALMAYERKGDISSWDDTGISPGQKWEAEILGKLEKADIVVLLLSNDFIRSDYCMQKEMKRALERDAAGECQIVPIVVRACAFSTLPLGQLQAILVKGKSVKEHRDRDAAWLTVTKQLGKVIAKARHSKSFDVASDQNEAVVEVP